MRRSRLSLAVLAAGAALAAVGRAAAPTAGPLRWDQRLEALDPDRPMDYFELAEEVADGAADDQERQLARRLFALAGVLGPQSLGRSSALALADMEARPHLRRRLRALAALLGERQGLVAAVDLLEGDARGAGASPAALLAVAEAFSHCRRGEGQRASAVLRTEGATELLEQQDRLLIGGLNRFLEDCRLYRGGRIRPQYTGEHLTRMIELEAALLAGERRTWAEELLIEDGAPLIEIDPDRLAETLGVDPERPLYRRGTWVERSPSRP